MRDVGAEDGEPLAVALTRPSTLFGTTLELLMLSLGLPVVAFLVTGMALSLLLMPLLLLASYLLCIEDIYTFEILKAMGQTKSSPTRKYWKCKTYAPR